MAPFPAEAIPQGPDSLLRWFCGLDPDAPPGSAEAGRSTGLHRHGRRRRPGIVFGARIQNVVGNAIGSGLGGLLPGGDRFRIYTVTGSFPDIPDRVPARGEGAGRPSGRSPSTTSRPCPVPHW
jgi:hypothetical protein